MVLNMALYIMMHKLKKILLFTVFFGIVFFMDMPPWGDLPKSQVDPQLITQAIDAAIAAHEADPTAHLGDGESLQQHKSNDVVDHPAMSIVPDKFSVGNTFLSLPVLPPDPGRADGLTASDGMPLLNLSKSSPATGDGFYVLTSFIPGDFGYIGGDAIFDFIGIVYSGSGSFQDEIRFSFGAVQFKAGNYRLGYFDGSWNYTAWTPVTLGEYMRFRFFYTEDDSTLRVYLRDIEILNITYTMELEDGEFSPRGIVNRGSGSSTMMGMGNFNVWFEGM